MTLGEYDIKMARCREATVQATLHGQDGCDAFEKAYERFDAQQRLTPAPCSWSETILRGDAARFYPHEDGESWIEVEWLEYFDREMANDYYYNAAQINSPYDCTGKAFMYGIHYFKAFGGYVVMTYWALDI